LTSIEVNPEAPTEVDVDTENWPVPNSLQAALCDIKRGYCVQPLRVYDNEGNFVEPNDVNTKLANALAEIHFSLKHYRIQRANEKPFDSFSAHVEQIIVLKAGTPKARSAYKRNNPRAGPLITKRVRLASDDKANNITGKQGTMEGQTKDLVLQPETTSEVLPGTNDYLNANCSPLIFLSANTYLHTAMSVTKQNDDIENSDVAESSSKTASTDDDKELDKSTDEAQDPPAVTMVAKSINPSTPVGVNEKEALTKKKTSTQTRTESGRATRSKNSVVDGSTNA
jgi:hypothetical protein